jgi:hypothetical protein
MCHNFYEPNIKTQSYLDHSFIFENNKSVDHLVSNKKPKPNLCSPLYLTMTAKYSQNNNKITKRYRKCNIKQCLSQYFERNNIKVFNFITPSPHDCVRNLRSGKRGSPLISHIFYN